MHVCEEFREKITDRIIDRQDIQDVELTRELLVCSSCADFYAESRDLMDAISEVHFEIPEEHWDAMADRLHSRIVTDRPAKIRESWFDRLGLSGLGFRGYATAMAGAIAILLVTFGIYRLSTPLVGQVAVKTEESRPTVNTPPVAVVTSNAPLDPVTVDFLEQSELLLRSVMKLQPTSIDDLKDARETAGRQLVALDQRKEAASEIPPVVNMMGKYELILREIRNLKGQAAAEDITDIQNRIEKNGLIADMQAFQPKVVAADADRKE
jgi:hypothetical protein